MTLPMSAARLGVMMVAVMMVSISVLHRSP